MKKLFRTLLTGILVVSCMGMFACGQKSSDSTTAAAETNAAEEQTQADTSAAAAENEELPELTMIIAHNGSEESINHYACEQIKRLFEEKSDGKITVQIYSGGSLGTERDCLNSVVKGDITFTVGASAATMSVIPEMAVFDIPFLFTNLEDARAAVDDEEFRSLLNAACEKEGYKLALLADQGFRVLTSDRKIETVEDLKGFNLRTMENQNHVDFWGMLGVNGIPMTQAEVYISLQQGLLNGQENPYNVCYGFKFYEVQDYLVETNHIFYAMTIMANEDYYNQLPEAYQKIYDEVFAEVTQLIRNYSDEMAAEYLELLKEGGMEQIILSDEVLSEMAELTSPIIDTIRGQIGDDLVDALIKGASSNK